MPDTLLPILLMCRGLPFLSMGHLKNKVYAMNPHTLEELKASIGREIESISEDELMLVNEHFLRR